MCLAKGPQPSDAGDARTPGLLVSCQALYHWATALPISYCKCSKISNTFLLLFADKVLVIRAQIYKMCVRIANRKNSDQTASAEAVWSESALFVVAFFSSN